MKNSKNRKKYIRYLYNKDSCCSYGIDTKSLKYLNNIILETQDIYLSYKIAKSLSDYIEIMVDFSRMNNKGRAYQFFMNYYNSEFNTNILKNRFEHYSKKYNILCNLKNHLIANCREKFLNG